MAKRTDQEKKQANTFPPVSNDIDVRRRVIEKPIGSAGAIGAVHWAGPVVRSVVLPAHAQTTPAASPMSPPPPSPPAAPGP